VTGWTSKSAAGVAPGDGGAGEALVFEDAALLERCRRGEMVAFGPLVRKYQDRVYNAILRMCGNPDDAEELCQETFVKALQNIVSFRQDSRLYTWLFRIAVNLTISHRRRASRAKVFSLESGGSDGEPSQRMQDALPDHRQAGPYDVVEARDTHRRVLAALGELEEEFQAVVVLRDMEDMNYEQISEVLGIPVGTVKSRLYRARCVLQEKLQDLIA
jgi:RNA polymerase sigma-70 factor (ECF subfamily)